MAEENSQQSGQQFGIQKIYLKDVSFESPNSPAVFSEGEWSPEVNVQINSTNQAVGQDMYETVLTITVTSKQGDKTAFLVEVKQAGIFAIAGFEGDALAGMLGAYCPETLFPFAREAIAELVSKGGFPQLYLAPVNFNAMYMQQKQNEASASQGAAH